jgi:heterodisulfide reductase subunit A
MKRRLGVADSGVLIVGGGIAGVTAALSLAEMGFSSTLVEKENRLGGRAAVLACKASDVCNKCFACVVDHQIQEVTRRAHVTALLESRVDQISGEPGRFRVRIQSKAHEQSLDAPAVILATGADAFDATEKPEYGYGLFQNVVTALDLDEMIRQKGGIYRPSDGQTPSRIAFFQCVGSRDKTLGHLWCSKVCCAYALRLMRAIRHHHPGSETSFFYIDIQPLGRSFGSLLQSCREDDGMRLIRSLPSKVYGHRESTDLRMKFIDPDSGEMAEEGFDLVVLSIGLVPRKVENGMAEVVDLRENREGFYKSPPTGSGVFVIGTSTGPKDIASSMIDAKATVQKVVRFFGRS